jgi:chromate transporter
VQRCTPGTESPEAPVAGATAAQVFRVAFTLGLSSFGGPLAHFGYFERTYVRRLQWLSHAQLTQLIALCQALPGPTSSQVGFLIGRHRAGLAGACAGWVGFTLPSAALMFAFALWAPRLPPAALASAQQALKWVAVMVVAQALWQMARALCPDRPRALIAALTASSLLLLHAPGMPLLALAAGAVLGAGILGGDAAGRHEALIAVQTRSEKRSATVAFVAFVLLLCAALLMRGSAHDLARLAALLYRSGSLVVGGGHVVLPLLQDALVHTGWLREDQFLAGYGAVQALPGPLFTFAAYLGAVLAPSGSSASWALVALIGLFLPGLLLAVAAVPVWGWLEHHAAARAALAGLNAAVVGLLGAALINPVGVSAIHGILDGAIVLAGLLALQFGRVPPIIVVIISLAISAALTALR